MTPAENALADGTATASLAVSEQSAEAARRLPSIVFLWEAFAAHHVDRCEACAAYFTDRFDVYGLEIATYDANYQWLHGRGSSRFTKLTLFPGKVRQQIGALRCVARIVRTVRRLGSRYVFLCNYESPAIFLSAMILRLLGRRIVIMQDSKFDDKQRRLPTEILKSLLYGPYHAALAAGPRTKAYLRFLGFSEQRVVIGYDTVSVDRVRSLAGSDPAPGGMPHGERQFTVIARFIPKKNLALALDAYAFYRAQHREAGHDRPPRSLHLCGSGELEQALREQAEQLGLEDVYFHGYLREDGIARMLASTLALILPSVEEQHGLVINEALAMGVPVLVSDNCGARDLLVRSGINGYIFEADNAQGLAYFMSRVDQDETEWRRLAEATHQFAPYADSGLFVSAVEQVLAHLASKSA